MTYLLTQLGISSLVLIAWFLLYKLAFAKLTFFALNRVYLLVGLVFAIAVPFMQFESPWALSATEPASKPESSVILIYDAPKHAAPTEANNDIPQVQTEAQAAPAAYSAPSENITINYTQVLLYIYFAGLMLSLIWFGVKLIKVNMIRGGSKTSSVGYKNLQVIINPGDAPSYSFFNKIYISESDFNSQFAEKIFEHEYLHFRKMHSLDLIFAEVFKAAMWFNPVIYMYCNAIRDNHEFEVDRTIVREEADKTEYYQSLVNRTIGAQFVDLPSYFNKSTLLRRFEMLDKKKSNAISLWKYISIIPVASLFILLFACTQPGKDNSQKASQSYHQDYSSDYDSIPEPKGGLGNFLHNAKKGLADYIGIDYKKSYASFYFEYRVNNEGKLVDVFIQDTNWYVNPPEEKLKHEYAAKAYQYFINTGTWHPATLKGKPVFSSHSVTLYYGTEEMHDDYQQLNGLFTTNKNLPNLDIFCNVPESYNVESGTPIIFKANFVKSFIKSITLPENANTQLQSGKIVLECDINKSGKITNTKVTKGISPIFDRAVITAFNKTTGLAIPTKNGKPITKHLKFKLNFARNDAKWRDYIDYIGYAEILGNNLYGPDSIECKKFAIRMKKNLNEERNEL